ncbi:MAG: zinc dependent phospholipase C family protein [Atopobiaceae bacterium]|nr:zinc dependent phospholipase C family protein [Atopobiaceae bacterium]
MPAILTHHLFGEDASALLPEDILTSQEELLAFLMGSQGPDLLCARFSTLPSKARRCHALARCIHEREVVAFLFSLRSSVGCLPHKDAGLGRAFVLGMAAHYLLDSVVHPLILAQIRELQSADSTLQDAARELHALIEADIDSWLLWQKRHITILDIPTSLLLNSTPRIDQVTGQLMSMAARDVFGLDVDQCEFGCAARDYLRIYRLIDPPATRIPNTLKRLELLYRSVSRIDAQRHPIIASDDCPAANLTHRPWHDPATGARSIASFADLFHDALLAWPAFAGRIIEGDRARTEAMVDGLNYYGMPCAE